MINCELGLGYTPEGRETLTIGAPAKDVVKAVLRNNQSIRWTYLHILSPRPELEEEDIGGDYDPNLWGHGAVMQLDRNHVFEKFVLEKTIARFDAFELKDLAGLVPDYKARRIFSHIWGFQKQKLRKEGYKEIEFMAVSSKVSAWGIWNKDLVVHIPMLDFQCQRSSENLAAVIDCLHDQEMRGFVLDSGGSYHFWGYDVFRGLEWEKFMEDNAQNPLVDPRFIKISRELGRASLRISTRSKCRRFEVVDGHILKHSIPERPTPRVVAFVGFDPGLIVPMEYNKRASLSPLI